jgi:hypothetical protein
MMLVEQETLVIPERVTAVRVICRACEVEQAEQQADGHFGATLDSSLRLEDGHGWFTCRFGHRIELIRAGPAR